MKKHCIESSIDGSLEMISYRCCTVQCCEDHLIYLEKIAKYGSKSKSMKTSPGSQK